MNLCIFSGALGADPESRYTKSGEQVASFRLAVNCGYGDHKRTEWLNCVAFKKQAEIICNHLQKGSKVSVTTELKTDKWQDKDGNDRYSQSYIIRDFEFLGGAKERSQDEQRGVPAPPSTGESCPF